MDESGKLAEKLRLEGEKLDLFLTGLSANQWGTTVYAEGTAWTVRSILVHLMSAESAFLKLFDLIRGGSEGVGADFDIDRYNAAQQRKGGDLEIQDLMNAFRLARGRMVEFVSGLSAADLERRGRHPFLGMTTLREMVKMIYIHNQAHQRDIRRALGAT